METSAGIILTYNKKILLCHPTSQGMFGTWSIPKGHIEAGEEILEAAYRETREEIGLSLNFNDIDPDPFVINYTKKGTNNVYKQIHCFHYEVKNLKSIGLSSEIISHDKLQHAEVDFAAFLDIENANKYIFWRLLPLLKYVQ